MGEPAFSKTKKENVIAMTDQHVPICGEHEISKEWKPGWACSMYL